MGVPGVTCLWPLLETSFVYCRILVIGTCFSLQIHDYVRSYLGETKQSREFAKEFVEKRSKYKNQLRQQQQQEVGNLVL